MTLNKSVEIKPLHLEHLDQILRIIKPHLHPITPGFLWDSHSIQQEFANALSLGYFENNKCLAFVFYRISFEVLEVSVLATASNNLNRGLQTKLLHELQNKHTEAQKIWLEVHRSNQIAYGFYQKMGFRQTGLRKSYYQDGGDALLLELVISR